jgi:hypothetical protein
MTAIPFHRPEGATDAASQPAADARPAGRNAPRELRSLSCSPWPRGMQNATARKLAIPDFTTTVLTLTLTGLAADSTPAGGSNPRLVRRVTAVAAMLAGAVAGAALMVNAGSPPPWRCWPGRTPRGLRLLSRFHRG